MRVLVVEDERGLAEGLRVGLEAEGFAVDVALDGPEGLWRASECTYDVIVLDLMLPGMSGFEVCTRLRDQGVWSPILVLTAKVGEWDEVEALDTGADDFLTKPFSHAVLVARLRALLRRQPRERPAVLVAGDLRVDPAERRVWRGDDEIELTPRELAVLEFLMRRRGEVVTKREALGYVALNAVEAWLHRSASDDRSPGRRRAKLLPEEGPVIRAFQSRSPIGRHGTDR